MSSSAESGSSAKLFASPAFKAFVKKRRSESAAALTSGALVAEWKELSEDARVAFTATPAAERGGAAKPAIARQLTSTSPARTTEGSGRGAAGVSAARGFFLEQQKKQVLLAATRPRPPSPTSRPQQKRQRKDALPALQLPSPNFPRRLSDSAAERGERRKELAESLKTQAGERGSAVSVASSHNVDLEEANACLQAPKLSFDWAPPASDDDDEAAAGDCDALEVDVPVEEHGGCARNVLRKELLRNISATRMQTMLSRPP